MSKDVIRALINNEEFYKKLIEMEYERLKNDLVLSRLNEINKVLSELSSAVQKNTDHIVLLWEKLEEHEEILRQLAETVRDQGLAIKEMLNLLRIHSQSIEGMQKILEQHSKAIEDMQKAMEKHNQILEQHSKAIEGLQKAVEKLEVTVENHSKAIEGLQKAVEKLEVSVENHSKAIECLQKEVIKLSTEIGGFTSRAGKAMERTILNVYKEALILHGIDPSKVKHGKIKDTLGVVDKEFEVDFYETDDYIYVFEIKNYADDAVLEQMRNRVKLFSALYNKPVKFFIVANYIEKSVKDEAEKEGATVIASYVIEEDE